MLRNRIAHLIGSGSLVRDDGQQALIVELDRLLVQLNGYSERRLPPPLCARSPNSLQFLAMLYASPTRNIRVPRAAGSVVCASFAELCARRYYGAAEYAELARHLSALCLEGVPQLASQCSLADVRRFIALIDQLTLHRCRLIVTADAPIDALFDADTVAAAQRHGGADQQWREDATDERASPSLSPSSPAIDTSALHSGAQEKFMFARAAPRLYELTRNN
jgi:predicted ATPase